MYISRSMYYMYMYMESGKFTCACIRYSHILWYGCRAVYMEDDKLGSSCIDEKLALAPVLDLLNHSASAEVTTNQRHALLSFPIFSIEAWKRLK